MITIKKSDVKNAKLLIGQHWITNGHWAVRKAFVHPPKGVDLDSVDSMRAYYNGADFVGALDPELETLNIDGPVDRGVESSPVQMLGVDYDCQVGAFQSRLFVANGKLQAVQLRYANLFESRPRLLLQKSVGAPVVDDLGQFLIMPMVLDADKLDTLASDARTLLEALTGEST